MSYPGISSTPLSVAIDQSQAALLKEIMYLLAAVDVLQVHQSKRRLYAIFDSECQKALELTMRTGPAVRERLRQERANDTPNIVLVTAAHHLFTQCQSLSERTDCASTTLIIGRLLHLAISWPDDLLEGSGLSVLRAFNHVVDEFCDPDFRTWIAARQALPAPEPKLAVSAKFKEAFANVFTFEPPPAPKRPLLID